jgi:hypothetical protein
VRELGSGDYAANVRPAGNFPGGTVDLQCRFALDGERIRRPEIG